ncbi:MAG: hypothetical protein COB36_02945 [Alphaproteobacteria bacterium]|nr:MAG: hypothetical protein COB36_02945 [Alphaproteobacteria bacterium]
MIVAWNCTDDRCEGVMDTENLRILIVDDHMIMRSLIEKTAISLGLKQISHAENGQQALDKINDGSVDIVLADWNMPEMCGFDLLKAIRQNEDNNNLAFIMITAESEGSKMMEAMNNGATAYLTKPFSSDDFRDTIDKILIWLEKRRN